jgi:hypothetical protein
MAGTNQVTWTDKVKTRTLPIPIINKIDDATVNELKNKHNALDTEMTDPTTGLKKVVEDLDNAIPEPDEDNFETPLDTNITYIKSLFGKKATFTFDFKRNTVHGINTLPIYQFLDIDLTDAIDENVVKVYHCGLVSPEVFQNIWDTPTATYVDQAAMIAAQGSQTAGLVYNIGTAYWRYLGTTLGTIADYQSVPPIVYSGDAYLTGVNNLNILTCRFLTVHKEGSFILENAILISNVSITGGNKDTNKPILELLINWQFNENNVVTENPNLTNSSFWATNGELTGEVSPASGAEYIDLGSGNFSLRTNTTNNSTTGGTPTIFLESTLFNRVMALGKFTFITRARRTSPSSANFVYLFKFMNDASSDGIRLAWEIDGTDNRMLARINGSNFTSPLGSVPFNQPEFILTAWTYSDADDRLRHYAEAPTYSPPIPFGLIHTNTITGARPITSTSQVVAMNRETTVGQRNNTEFDFAIFIADELPQAVIEDIKDNPTNVQSILRTYYGY